MVKRVLGSRIISIRCGFTVGLDFVSMHGEGAGQEGEHIRSVCRAPESALCVCVGGDTLPCHGSREAYPEHRTQRARDRIQPADAELATCVPGFILPQSLGNGLCPHPPLCAAGKPRLRTFGSLERRFALTLSSQAGGSADACRHSLSEQGVWGGGGGGFVEQELMVCTVVPKSILWAQGADVERPVCSSVRRGMRSRCWRECQVQTALSRSRWPRMGRSRGWGAGKLSSEDEGTGVCLQAVGKPTHGRMSGVSGVSRSGTP